MKSREKTTVFLTAGQSDRTQTVNKGENMKVIIVAHNQLKLVQMEIEALRLLAGIGERDLIIVDNASQDGLRQWLEERPGINYLVCDEGRENYSTILNYAKTEFVTDEDILLLDPCYMILPDAIEEMQRLL